jgi:hypothetical protein
LSTARDIIKRSLRLIGVLASGETPTSDQSNDALDRLNGMIKSWSIEGLMVFKVTRETFTLTASQSSRTMGSGGNFDTTRPERIIRVGAMDGTSELPVEIVTVEQWAAISDKSSTSTIPYRTYIEGTYPLETLNFWPVPSASSTLVVYSRKAINSTLALTDTISLPDGYEEVLEYNLAVRQAPEYGRQLDPLLLDTAQELKACVMRQNLKPSFMDTDGPVSKGRFNIYRGM